MISGTVKATITAAVGELISLKTQEIFSFENITLYSLFMQNFETFDAILFFVNSQKSPFLQAVKLVVPLNYMSVYL